MITLINKKREQYQRTPSNKGWSTAKKNITVSNLLYSKDQYDKFVDSISFFNNIGYCRGYKSYHSIGYIVDKIVSINPTNDVKYIDYFDFISLDEKKLYDNMGNREKEIYNNLEYFEIEYHQRKKYISFYNKDKSFMMDYNTYKIVN